MEWHYYLVACESGHRISAAVTIEGPMVDRMSDIDRQMIHGLELFPPQPAAQSALAPDSTTTELRSPGHKAIAVASSAR